MKAQRLESTRSFVALATCARYPHLTSDDRLLLDVLRARGITAEPAVWDDAGISWDRYDAIVIRSCWDYHLRLAEFLAWIEHVERSGVALWNSAPVLRWNASKTYLRNLAARGVDVVPTHWVEAGSEVSLATVMEKHDWGDVVIKPAVSASAYRTRRVDHAAAATQESWFRSLAATGGVLVQPYLREIESVGEWSLIFIVGDSATRCSNGRRRAISECNRSSGGTTSTRFPTDRSSRRRRPFSVEPRRLACTHAWMVAS